MNLQEIITGGGNFAFCSTDNYPNCPRQNKSVGRNRKSFWPGHQCGSIKRAGGNEGDTKRNS